MAGGCGCGASTAFVVTRGDRFEFMDPRITSAQTTPVSHALDSAGSGRVAETGPISSSVFRDVGRHGRRSRDPSPDAPAPRGSSGSPKGLPPRAALSGWPKASEAGASAQTPQAAAQDAPMSPFGGTVGLEAPAGGFTAWNSSPTVRLEPRPPLDPTCEKTHLVWVGKPVPAAELTAAMHMAARGGEVNLWTDQPAKAMASALSMTSPTAGAIDSGVHLVPAGHGNDEPATRQIRLRHVDEAFAGQGRDRVARRLDLLQASEGVGLGNPGARSDIVRYQVLHREGGVYMDFDRADQLRRDAERALPASGPHLDIGGAVPLPPGGLRLTHSGHMRYSLNNDLLVSAPGSRGSDALRQATAAGLGALGQTPALVATPYTLSAYADTASYRSAYGEPLYRRQAERQIADTVDPKRTAGALPPHPPAWSATRPSVLDQARDPATRSTAMGSVTTEAVLQGSGPGAAQRAARTEGWTQSNHNGLTFAYSPELAARYAVERIGMPPSAGSWARSAGQALPTSFEAPEAGKT